ncbi:hypothetical protein GCM10010381_06430 [Streptomyces xantholiticus]|nr:hypothetical protein GCM10010381_06430 [Streptomyces xantholiticus]
MGRRHLVQKEPDYTFITHADVTVDEAALFATWLRDSFEPASGLVRFARRSTWLHRWWFAVPAALALAAVLRLTFLAP